jgi:hypothetical protein
MKCINCGLPLSPNNTQMICPRCHATSRSGPNAAIGHALTPQQPSNNNQQGWNAQEAQVDQQRSSHMQGQSVFYSQAGTPVQVQSPPPTLTPVALSSQNWNTEPQHNQLSFPPVAQIPFPQPGQIWNSASTPPPTPTPTPIPIPGTFGSIDNNQSNPSLPPLRTTGNMYASANTFERPRAGHVKRNLGFIIATIFVATGALLLVLVYILALGLPMHNLASTLIGTPQATRSILPTPTLAASTPTAQPTPTTSAFPGQQFIDNPQMASAINFNTAQPVQTTTTFKVNQRIYVTFAIHPNGRSGAICLYWFLNNHAVTQFPFPVTAAARAAYSYAIYGGTGNGYVEIYWASTTACSDRMLAQHVTFTVTT